MTSKLTIKYEMRLYLNDVNPKMGRESPGQWNHRCCQGQSVGREKRSLVLQTQAYKLLLYTIYIYKYK